MKSLPARAEQKQFFLHARHAFHAHYAQHVRFNLNLIIRGQAHKKTIHQFVLYYSKTPKMVNCRVKMMGREAEQP